MIYYSLITLTILIITNLFSNVIIIPELDSRDKEDFMIFKGAFNNEEQFCKSVVKLMEKFNLTMAVETGSNVGLTTKFFESIFNRVDAFEINKVWLDYSISNSRPKCMSNYHLGNSGDILIDVLNNVRDERIFFYLDAHWGSYWPLRDEIKQITYHFKDNCILMIDDVKVPGYNEINYDNYNGMECSYEYVKDLIDELFTGYKVYFLITQKKFRGKLLIIPDSYSLGKELTGDDF